MTRPVLVSEGIPVFYSRDAIAAQAQGLIMARCVVTLAGAVENCRAIKTVPIMEPAVFKSLQSRRYKPAEQNGQPVAVDYLFTIKVSPPPR
jgi:serine/threonine-protein kinase